MNSKSYEHTLRGPLADFLRCAATCLACYETDSGISSKEETAWQLTCKATFYNSPACMRKYTIVSHNRVDMLCKREKRATTWMLSGFFGVANVMTCNGNDWWSDMHVLMFVLFFWAYTLPSVCKQLAARTQTKAKWVTWACCVNLD